LEPFFRNTIYAYGKFFRLRQRTKVSALPFREYFAEGDPRF
jgi:hypothetical protein